MNEEAPPASAPEPKLAPAASPEPAPAQPRRKAWALALGLVLALAVGLHLWLQGLQPPDPGVPPESVAAAVAGTAGSAVPAMPAAQPGEAPSAEPGFGQPAEAAARVGRAAEAALATARAAAGLGPRLPAEQVFELCGLGRMSIPEQPLTGPDATFEALPRPIGLFARQQAWSRLLPLMEQAEQPERVRAAALVLRASGLLAAEAAPGAPQGPGPAELAAMQADTRALARLARGSSDGYVLHWALSACDRVLAAGLPECRRISPRDLARAAPDEAQAWLQLAAMPGLAAAERQTALERAAAAPRHGSLDMRLPAVLDSVWPEEHADWPDYLRLQLLVQAIGVDTSLGITPLQQAARLCDSNALQDPARRQQCEAIARQMQTHARSLLQLNLAAGLGSRLGWSDRETASMRAETERLMRYTPEPEPAGQPFGCAAVQDTRSWVQAVAREGELAELRRRATQATPAKPASSRP